MPYANVIFDLERDAALETVHGYLDDIGIAYCGRYGDWGYMWTDESFISGERAATDRAERAPADLRRSPGARAPLTVSCIGAHADDIEIGCGGTILRLLAERQRVTVHWVVLCSDVAARDGRRAAVRRGCSSARRSTTSTSCSSATASFPTTAPG